MATIIEADDVMKEFNRDRLEMASEIVDLRKNQMPEEIPDVTPLYAIRQHCATGMLVHFTLQHEEPDSNEDYMILYRPTTKE